jgi:hypothetical protein
MRSIQQSYFDGLFPAEVLEVDKWLTSVSDRLIVVDSGMTAGELASIAKIYADRGRELVITIDYLQQLSPESTSAH